MALYWVALATAFTLSLMLISAGMDMGFRIDLTTPTGWWAILLILNPFIGFALRQFNRARFDHPLPLAALASAMLTIVAIHVATSLYLDG
jgi:hypothetical protein